MIVNKQKYFVIIFLTVLLSLSCDESVSDDPLVNQAPETNLFLYPDGEISKQKSRLQVHWWGDDKDGLVTGFIFKWEGIDDRWSFTTNNDSVFALPIGTVDTSFVFYVSAVDNSGNLKYDDKVFLNGEEIMSEPYIDENNNNKYDEGERFFDFGAIDESPASQAFPIKNSAPEISWNDISVLPEISFPVITVGWDAADLDGNETITEIQIALNDTLDYLSLPGSTRLISLIIDDLETAIPAMDVFINADNDKKFEKKLPDLRLNDNNRLFIKAVDNSGASSHFIPLPDTSRNWFVTKPNGKLLIVDDFSGGEQAADFYRENFDKFAAGNFNVFDIENTELPYEAITFQNTINLFDFIFWYSGSSPRIDLTNLIAQNFLQNGGNLFFSMTFRDSSANFDFSTQIVQSFLPIAEFDNADPLPFLFPGANLIPSEGFTDYPTLETESTVGFVRAFKVAEITASKVYDMTSSQLNGTISLMNNTKNLFFIGLPLHQCNARGNVAELLEEVFVNEFGFEL